MNLVEVAPLQPGSCFVTGRSDGPFIDTGLDVDDRPLYGRIYLAGSFISDCAAEMGGLGPEAAQILRDRLAAADTRIAELEAALEGMGAANSALFAAGYRPPGDETPVEVVAEVPEPSLTAEENADAVFAAMDDTAILEACIDRGIDPGSNRDEAIAALKAQVTA